MRYATIRIIRCFVFYVSFSDDDDDNNQQQKMAHLCRIGRITGKAANRSGRQKKVANNADGIDFCRWCALPLLPLCEWVPLCL